MESSSKRAKAPCNITQIAHCLVDGCNADLSQCRDYHRRHKVCETHSKTPKVTIGGREQRFCQQCSRFHSLVEFDEGKRSCRKRLEGHNRRRRKSQPDSLARNPAIIFPSHQQTTTLLSFGAPQILQTSVVGPAWAPQAENETMLFNHHHHHHHLNYIERANSFPETSAHNNYKGGLNHQLQFVQREAATCRPAIGSNGEDGLNEVVDSDRALSLLSSAPSVTRDPQSLVHSLQYSGLSDYGARDPHCGDESTLHFTDMFQQGNEGSSTSGSHQTLTFMWE